MQKVSLSIKTKIWTSSRKKWEMNLNNYHNSNHFDYARAKKAFNKIMWYELMNFPVFDKINIHYELFVPTNSKLDTNNILSIVDKFFMDALVISGKLPEDSKEYIQSTVFSFGGIDRTAKEKYVNIYIEETSIKPTFVKYLWDNVYNRGSNG